MKPMKPTFGKDFMNFYVLIKFLELKQKHSMIIFNNKLKITEIRKEPLFIWWILNILNSHPFISKYKHMCQAVLQKSLDSKIAENNSKRYDIYFGILKVIVEIDEEGHGNTTLDNDVFKDSLARMNGMLLIRLYTRDIMKELPTENGPNAATECNELNKFKDILINAVMGSLMRFNDIRQARIKYLFEKDLIEELEELESKIHIQKDLAVNNGNKHIVKLNG